MRQIVADGKIELLKETGVLCLLSGYALVCCI